MARKAPPAPAPKGPADIPLRAIPDAIRKLERRLNEFQEFDPAKFDGDLYDQAERLCSKLSATLAEVFGPNTLEFERVEMSPSSFMLMVMTTGATPRYKEVQEFDRGRLQAIERIKAQIEILKERAEDSGEDSTSKALRAYGGLELHPAIQEAAGELFKNGHYANAIEDAVKALNAFVRYRSGLELDGTTLMERAFSVGNPVLRFNDLADESDRNEQKGFMQMFSGAVAGLRNPRAHKLIKDDPERALEFIAFVSLLAKLAEKAIRVRPAAA